MPWHMSTLLNQATLEAWAHPAASSCLELPPLPDLEPRRSLTHPPVDQITKGRRTGSLHSGLKNSRSSREAQIPGLDKDNTTQPTSLSSSAHGYHS
jgi:hypothetical protein